MFNPLRSKSRTEKEGIILLALVLMLFLHCLLSYLLRELSSGKYAQERLFCIWRMSSSSEMS